MAAGTDICHRLMTLLLCLQIGGGVLFVSGHSLVLAVQPDNSGGNQELYCTKLAGHQFVSVSWCSFPVNSLPRRSREWMSDPLHKDWRSRPTEGGWGGGGGLSSKWQQQSGTEQQNSQGSRRWSSMGSIEYSEQHGVVRSDQVEGWGG